MNDGGPETSRFLTRFGIGRFVVGVLAVIAIIVVLFVIRGAR